MQFSESDEQMMRHALGLAAEAAHAGEIPIGAVIAREGIIIARGRNRNRAEHNPVRHAEIEAIEAAARELGNERLNGCELFVTKEPCVMCAGAITHARIERVVIAAEDVKYGAAGTVLSVLGNPLLNHQPRIEFGLLRDESRTLLQEFFRRLRS